MSTNVVECERSVVVRVDIESVFQLIFEKIAKKTHCNIDEISIDDQRHRVKLSFPTKDGNTTIDIEECFQKLVEAFRDIVFESTEFSGANDYDIDFNVEPYLDEYSICYEGKITQQAIIHKETATWDEPEEVEITGTDIDFDEEQCRVFAKSKIEKTCVEKIKDALSGDYFKSNTAAGMQVAKVLRFSDDEQKNALNYIQLDWDISDYVL